MPEDGCAIVRKPAEIGYSAQNGTKIKSLVTIALAPPAPHHPIEKDQDFFDAQTSCKYEQKNEFNDQNGDWGASI
jgi:hypothetical protein